MSAPFRSHWGLDPEVRFLNHGSFGACPTAVLQRQSELRARMEAGPVRFLHREIEPLLDEARAALAAFIDADPDDVAFVPNATAGVNTVLRSLRFAPGDELLTTDHEYNASRNALEYVASQWGAKVVVAKLPWPVPSNQAVVDAVLAQVTPRTRLLLIDHVSSPTAVVMPVERLITEMRQRGIETLIDGAHAPGMLPLSMRWDVGYYTGNCHKWMCAPKGAAFLYVRKDLQAGIKPLSISHGHNSGRTDRSRFRLDFDWTGTHDPTPFLCVPDALRVMGGMLPGGWFELMQANRQKAVAARQLLCERLRVEPPCPDSMLGSMAAVGLPDGFPVFPVEPRLKLDPLQLRLFDEHRIEVPIIPWPKAPRRHVRVSAQVYNTHAEYQALADALEALLR